MDDRVDGDLDEGETLDSSLDPRTRQEYALSELEADDPESKRIAARTLFEQAIEHPHLFDATEIRGTLIDHRFDPAVRPFVHGVLHYLTQIDTPDWGDRPDLTLALKSDDDEERRVAAAAYVHHNVSRYQECESEVDALIDLVTDHTASIDARSQAARALSYRDNYSEYRPRPTGILSALIEITDRGTVDGRAGAVKLLTETVVHNDETSFDDDLLDAVAETVANTMADESYRVRLRAIAPFCEEHYGFKAVLGDRLKTIAEPLAVVRNDDHPRVAERANDAWHKLQADERDLLPDAESADEIEAEDDLVEQVKALPTDDPEELAANASTIVAAFDDTEASNHAAEKAVALTQADPDALLKEEGAITALADLTEDGSWGQRDAAVALGTLITHDPSVTDSDTALCVLSRLGYAGTYAEDRIPGRAWTALGVASGADTADGDDESLRRVRTYVESLDVDPVEFLIDCWNENVKALSTIAFDTRGRIGDRNGLAARGILALGEVDPELWCDALPAAIRALEDSDYEDRIVALSTIQTVATAHPGRVEDAIEELLTLVCDPHPEIREGTAWACWHVGQAADTDGRLDDLPETLNTLVAYDESTAERQPLWPAGALAREHPRRVESAVVAAVDDRLDERSKRTAGEHLGSLLAEVHSGDPDVGRPAVERLLATIRDDDHSGTFEGETIRSDVSAALASVADRYAETIVEHVDGIVACALSANWSSDRRMRNAVCTLDALVEENYDDAVYAAFREHVSRESDSERGSHDAYITRHGYFAEESESVADLFFDAALAERVAARERLERGVRGLLPKVSADDITTLSDERARAIAPELARRLCGHPTEGDGTLENFTELRPDIVADHVEAVGELLDEWHKGPRTVGVTVTRTLATHDPVSIRPIAKQVATRIADEDDEAILRASADALARLAREDSGLVATALEDCFDHYDTDADAPADVLNRCNQFQNNQPRQNTSRTRFLSDSDDERTPTRQVIIECFEAAGIDPERTADDH